MKTNEQKLRDALKTAECALENSYDLTCYPATENCRAGVALKEVQAALAATPAPIQSESGISAADAIHMLRLALVQAECAIKGREHTGFITKVLVATERDWRALATPAQPIADVSAPTDELPITRSTYGTKEACEAEHQRRASKAAIAQPSADQVRDAASVEVRNICEIDRSSDMGVTIKFMSARAASQFVSELGGLWDTHRLNWQSSPAPESAEPSAIWCHYCDADRSREFCRAQGHACRFVGTALATSSAAKGEA